MLACTRTVSCATHCCALAGATASDSAATTAASTPVAASSSHPAPASSTPTPTEKVGGGYDESLNPAAVPNDRTPDLAAGVAFNVYNNLWRTNGIQFYPFELGSAERERDRDWAFRFRMEVPV